MNYIYSLKTEFTPFLNWYFWGHGRLLYLIHFTVICCQKCIKRFVLNPCIYLLSVVTTDDVLTWDAGIPKDFPTCDVITLDGEDSTAVRAGRTKSLESTNQYSCNCHWQSCLIEVDNLVEYF